MTSTNYVCDSDYLLHKSKDFCKESQTPYFEKCRKIPEPNENHIIFNKAKDDINGDKHKGLIDACNMILEWIEEMEETPWKEMRRYK